MNTVCRPPIGVTLDTLVSRYSRLKYCILRLVAKRTKTKSEMRAMKIRPLVSVVDDDESVRESLPDLLKELGFDAKTFASAEEFLNSDSVAATRCLILDVAMPGMSGPELQLELASRGWKASIIFITARPDERTRRKVIEQGAVDYLLKPFSEQQLQRALDAALQQY